MPKTIEDLYAFNQHEPPVKTIEEYFLREFFRIKNENEKYNHCLNEACTELRNVTFSKDKEIGFYKERLEACEKLLHRLNYTIVGDMIKIEELTIFGKDEDKKRNFDQIKETALRSAKGEWSVYDKK